MSSQPASHHAPGEFAGLQGLEDVFSWWVTGKCYLTKYAKLCQNDSLHDSVHDQSAVVLEKPPNQLDHQKVDPGYNRTSSAGLCEADGRWGGIKRDPSFAPGEGVACCFRFGWFWLPFCSANSVWSKNFGMDNDG